MNQTQPPPQGLAPEEVVPALLACFGGAIPHDRALGISYRAPDAGGIEADLPFRDDLAGAGAPAGLDAASLNALIDTACGMALLRHLPDIVPVATLNLRIDSLAAPPPGAGAVCGAQVIHRQGSDSAVRAEARDAASGMPLAVAAGRFIIRRHARLERPAMPALPPAETRPAAATASPFDRFMGFGRGPGGTTLMAFRPELIGNPMVPSLHGGATAALAHRAALAAGEDMAPGAGWRVTSLSVDYLRFGRPETAVATTRLRRLNRTFASVDVAIRQGLSDAPIVEARALIAAAE